MSANDHDPLCPQRGLTEVSIHYLKVDCSCDLIARVRADERRKAAEEIAQALETDLQTSHWHTWVDEEADGDSYRSIVVHGVDQVRSDAAAIARRIGGAS